MLVEFATLLITLALIFIIYFKWSFKYWEQKNIPYLTPVIPFGNAENPYLRKNTLGVVFRKFYDEFRSRGEKHGGVYIFTSCHYMPIDPEYVRIIMSKDFNYFVDRGFYYNKKDDPISAHLLSLEGAEWKNLRAKLTPTFSSGKMKMMFPKLLECGAQLTEAMEHYCATKECLDIKEALVCFTTDIIGTCAFGIECNSFKTPNSPFRQYGNKVISRTRLRNLKMTFCFSFPKTAQYLRLKAVPTDVADFFTGVVKDTVAYREKNNITRDDFIQILIDLKNNKPAQNGIKHDGKRLTIEEIVAQSFVFFLAGFETSSTTMTFCLYHLAKHQDIQQKVRDEIKSVLAKYDGKITYEALSEMKYLVQVIDESLRLHPPIPFVGRVCTSEYTLPYQEDVVLEKGTNVIIPIMGLHHDPQYFPNPEVFDPERFNEENKKKITPYTYLPFGEGPRNCIGLRFGMMESKVGLTLLLNKFKFTLNPKTKLPLEMDPTSSIVLNPQGGIWLDVEKV